MDFNGVLAGLGNPGAQYQGSRHNMGFMALETLLEELARLPGASVEPLSGAKFQCRLWRCVLPGTRLPWLAVMPQTFMNRSGDSVQPLMAWYKISPQKLLVIHDELDLEPGRIKLKSGGGIAGHNGLKSIVQRLGTQDFYRLRIGVGRPPDRDNVISWVLGRFPSAETPLVEASLKEAAEAILCFAAQGPTKAANQYNGRKSPVCHEASVQDRN